MKNFILVGALVTFQLMRIATAESIYIEDASFDDIAIPDGTSSNLIYNPTAAEYPIQPPHGENVCRIRKGWPDFDEGPVDIPISHSVIPNSFYVLEVNVASTTSYTGFGIELWAGTNMLESASAYWAGYYWGQVPPEGEFQTVTVPAYIPEGHPASGSQLMVRLTVSMVIPPGPPPIRPLAEAHFDHIRLNRYDEGPTTSITAVDTDSIQLHFSNLATNVVYKWELIDNLTPSNQVVNYDYFYADDITNSLTTPVLGNQGFIKLKTEVP